MAFDSGQEVALTLEREPRHLGGEQTFFPVPKLRLAGATPLRASRALFALPGLRYRCQGDRANWEPLLRRAGKSASRRSWSEITTAAEAPYTRSDYYQSWVAELVRLERSKGRGCLVFAVRCGLMCGLRPRRCRTSRAMTGFGRRSKDRPDLDTALRRL